MVYDDRIMRMADSVPQRTVGPQRPQRPPGQPSSGRHMGYGGGRPPGPPSNIGRDRMGGIFGGQGASGANDMVNAMLGGMNTSQLQLQREDELAKFSPDDWRNIWRLQQRGIDPGPHIEQTYWGGPRGRPQWPPRPGDPFPRPGDPFPDPWPPNPWEDIDIAERSSDFGSDFRGQQMLYDRIIKANPGLGEDELMILFQQAMDKALS